MTTMTRNDDDDNDNNNDALGDTYGNNHCSNHGSDSDYEYDWKAFKKIDFCLGSVILTNVDRRGELGFERLRCSRG